MARRIYSNMLKTVGAVFACAIVGGTLSASAQSVSRMEPLCWWDEMHTPLTLMLYGEDLKDASVRIAEPGMSVKKVHNAESPNYLFLDLSIEKSGKYTIEISKAGQTIKVPYEIYDRREGSREREGLTTRDVIYLMMPDRFANGDERNDVIAGSTQKLDRKGLEDRHGGDIQGIIDHLDYLADLGVTTLWSTPLLEDNQFYHHYAISDYYTIDPHFGTNELYRKMVADAHSKGLKVIQDVVPNHCSSTHWWMKDLPFKDWVTYSDSFTQCNYALYSFSDPHASETDRELCAKGWWIECLPDMNLSNPFTLQYLKQMAIWWIEYANLDALRVDTYFYMGKEVALWTKGIREEYPNMQFVGEVWGNDASVVSYWVGDKPKHDGFASHLPKGMDFPFEAALITGLASDNMAFGGTVMKIYNQIAQDFLFENANEQLVIFADNHDTSRVYNMLGKDIDKVKLAMSILLTTRGLPQIYTGTELLFEDDPRGGMHQCRMDFPGGWKTDPVNLFDEKQRSARQKEMFDFMKKLLHFRKATPALYDGKLMHFCPIDNVYTYFRYDGQESVMVVVNASPKAQRIDWPRFKERLEGKSAGVEVLSGRTVTVGSPVEVEAKEAMIIHFK